ncbi:endonuclease domain-containing 1 protein-like [Agelaius phoeniceus]|uniref:endonuclease domain-containing 1 protein-like n=1 Tax=Agelaius phoeniceus TaxID=39638 RepID=UPI004054EE2A
MLGLLLLLQVLASCLWLGHSEVVKSFVSCPQFFYSGLPPNDALNPRNPAWICQRLSNSYHYATLYDRDRRIPVYSAYKYRPGAGKRPDVAWLLEPQLIGENDLKEMTSEMTLMYNHKFTLDQIKDSQAIPGDYTQLKGLDRGHLCPSGHLETILSMAATFTQTNIVPQDRILNNGKWNTYESDTMPEMTKGCKNTFVVTGAVPGNTYVSNGRVNKPSHIWSAACCVVDKNPTKAWGIIAENDKNEVQNMTLGELEERLTELYNATVTLFGTACPRQ